MGDGGAAVVRLYEADLEIRTDVHLASDDVALLQRVLQTPEPPARA
jgi:hypothetical protein